MPQINRVDVARLSAEKVSTLLALGKTHAEPRAPKADVQVESLIDHLDPYALKLLLADLSGPIVVANAGPLSFARLAEISAADAGAFGGQSYLRMLTSSRTSRDALETLAGFGKRLEASTLPDSTRRAGAAICALARLALHSRYGRALDKAEAAATTALVKSLAATRAAMK